MGAVATVGIEGISARYAAQIRELLYVQAIKRMAAEQEAARAEAEAQRNALADSMRSRVVVDEPVKVAPETAKAAQSGEPAKQPVVREHAPAAVAPAQIFDEQA